MTANSFTGAINTEGEYVTVESVTVGQTGGNFTGFTAGKTYTIQMKQLGYWKAGYAEYTIETSTPWTFTMGEDDPYIKTNGICMLTILENYQEA